MRRIVLCENRETFIGRDPYLGANCWIGFMGEVCGDVAKLVVTGCCTCQQKKEWGMTILCSYPSAVSHLGTTSSQRKVSETKTHEK